MTETIAIYGLGEAGTLFATDLVKLGIPVNAYDPADVDTPVGVRRHDAPADAVADAGIVLALTGGADAMTAIRQALDEIPKTALYADLSTNSAGTKKSLAEAASSAALQFVDVALMTTVPGNGLYTPALAAGDGADRYVDTFAAMGVPVERVSTTPGDAAIRKLLRSVVVKGLAALVIEAMRAGNEAGCSEWLWRNVADQIAKADEAFVARLVNGTEKHAVRRLHEMETCAALLEELGVDPVLTRATVENLRRIPAEGVPKLPNAN